MFNSGNLTSVIVELILGLYHNFFLLFRHDCVDKYKEGYYLSFIL